MMNLYFAAGDLGSFWKEQIQQYLWLPTVYRADIGFGWSGMMSLWLDYPFRLVVKALSTIGVSWWMIDKLLWAFVFAIAITSSYKLARYVLGNTCFVLLSSLIYSCNTYILLLFGGGQLGVALAYALSPFVLYKFIRHIDIQIDCKDSIKYQVVSIKYGIENGLWLTLLVCFDLRLAYLVMGAVGMYLVLSITYKVSSILYEKKIPYILYFILYTLVLPVAVALVIHLFWILPMIMVRGVAGGLGEDYTNIGMLKFLSVADYSHALSLLHPNWPENLFGKVYFLQPEFLAIPIMAFSSLLFIDISKRQKDIERSIKYQVSRIKYEKKYLIPNTLYFIQFFALLSLLGVFLAKGTNEPFGGVYTWLFSHIPGFIMFRDPTKFYLYIAIGYSILIPYALERVSGIRYKVLGIKYAKFIHNTSYVILYTFFVIFWCFTIRAVFTGQVTGNFRPLQLTSEYAKLKDVMVHDNEPYRTLWIPRYDKFMYSSDTHPVLTADMLWKNASTGALLSIIKDQDFYKTISEGGVRYIIIPRDLEKRMFLSDYRYDPELRNTLVHALSNTQYQKLDGFGELDVFENTVYTFQSSIPEYVSKQEYWSRVGLILEGGIFIFIGILCMYKRKRA